MARREAAPREAQRELDNIAWAILQSIVTPTTKAMLEDAERRVTACEAAVREPKQRPAHAVMVKTAIDRYLADLRATLASDIDEARRLLARGFDRIVLQRDEDGHLRAEVRGNLAGLLDLEDPDLVARAGAGGAAPPSIGMAGGEGQGCLILQRDIDSDTPVPATAVLVRD